MADSPTTAISTTDQPLPPSLTLAAPCPAQTYEPAPNPSVLIIDDHRLFATALRMTLRQHNLIAHQAPSTGAETILAYAATLPAGLAVLDVHLGRDAAGGWVEGCALVAPLRGRGWAVLIVSSGYDEPSVAAAVAAGAIGVIDKTHSFERFLAAIVAAAAGRPVMTEQRRQEWLARHRGHRLQQRHLSWRFDQLSGREREVLALLVGGHRAGEIAEHFTVSLSTVRTEIGAILDKLDVKSQLEAVALASQHPYLGSSENN